jgi:hypothetical protein
MSDKAHPGHGKRILAAIAAANAQRNKSLFAGSIDHEVDHAVVVVQDQSLPDSRTPFTYASLDAEQQKVAKDAAQFIDNRQRGMASAVLEIGQKLNEVKAALGHGLFAAWVEASFNMTMRTAQNYMQAATALGSESETVSYLPVSTVYAIAKAPEAVRAKVIEGMATTAAPLPVAKVSALIREARNDMKVAAIEARKTPDQKRRERLAKEKRARENREFLLERGKREVAAEQARVALVELLVASLGDDVAKASELLTISQIDSRVLASRLSGVPYGKEPNRFGELEPRTREQWLEHLAALERGERLRL